MDHLSKEQSGVDKRKPSDSFEEIVRQFQKPLLNFLFHFVHNETTAMDLAQEVFVKAWRYLDRYDGRVAFSTWLFAIASNHAKDHLRRHKAEVPFEDVEASLPNPHGSAPDRVLETAELGKTIHQCLAKLPVEYREAVVLRHINGLSMEQIAATLQLPVGTVKTNLFRGRQMLQKELLKITGGFR